MTSDFQDMSALMLRLLDSVAAKAEIPNGAIPTPLGFPVLDATRIDFQPGDVVLIATKSSETKASMMINSILQIGNNPKTPSLCFGEWVNLNDMATTFVSAVGRIDQAALRAGVMSDSDWPRLTEAVEQLRHLPWYFFNGGTITLPKLKSTASGFYRKIGRISQIVVDASCLRGRQEANLTNIGSLSIGELQLFLDLAKKLQCFITVICASTSALECKIGHSLADGRAAITIEPITATFLFRSECTK